MWRLTAPLVAVDRVDAPDVARARVALLVARCGEVDRDLVRHQRDVGVRVRRLEQRVLHRPAGRVGDVDDAAVRVAALAGEVERAGFLGEGDAEFLEACDRLRAHG